MVVEYNDEIDYSIIALVQHGIFKCGDSSRQSGKKLPYTMVFSEWLVLNVFGMGSYTLARQRLTNGLLLKYGWIWGVVRQEY